MSLPHITHISDLGPAGVERVLELAQLWKQEGYRQRLDDKVFGMVFFNPSLRTRTSFEAALIREGGKSITLDIGAGTWNLEHREGVRMDGGYAEHLKEAAPVLSRFVDGLGVRAFSSGESDAEDEADQVIRGFRKWATVPVLSLESAREHPCQGLADLLTIKERFGKTKNVPVTLSWAPHIKPLPRAVPNSFLLTAAAAGCDVRIAHPKGFELTNEVMSEATQYAQESGGSISVTHDQEEGLRDSYVLYAKAWRPAEGLSADLDQPSWMPTLKHFEPMNSDSIFIHCLPTRRNLEVADEVLDSPRSAVVDEAENRFHVQRVLLAMLLGGQK